jgi:hypothetical protein
MAKRFLSFLLAVAIGWSSVVTPSRAFAPVAVLAAPQIVTASGSYAIGALAGLVGLVGMYLEIKDAQNQSVRIPLNGDAIPAPSAPATAPSQQNHLWFDYGAGSPSAAAACQHMLSISGPNTCEWSLDVLVNVDGTYAACNLVGGKGGSGCLPQTSHAWEDTYILTSSTTSCPSGYSVSGSDCVLSDARQAVSDGKRDFAITGTGTNMQFEKLPDLDNCGTQVCTAVDGVLRGDGGYTKSIWVPGVHELTGEPALVRVAIAPDGTTVYVDHFDQVNNGQQTQVVQTTATIDTATRTITGVSTNTQVGSISAPTSSTLEPTSTANPTPQNTPTVQVNPTSQVINPIQFPNVTCPL